MDGKDIYTTVYHGTGLNFDGVNKAKFCNYV
jgi:hypothetical protein